MKIIEIVTPVENLSAVESIIDQHDSEMLWVSPEDDDAGLYDINGLIANAKDFLNNDDCYEENPGLIKELSQA